MDDSRKQNLKDFQIGRVLWAALLSALIVTTASADPGDSALPGNHPLTQSQAGDVLIAELRCAACHGGGKQDIQSAKAAPNLLDVGARVSPDYLKRFLASPSTAQPGTTMPDLLASKTEAERETIAEALTHFLVVQSQQVYEHAAVGQVNSAEGKALFHSVGCVACHGPREQLGEEFLFQKPVGVPGADDEDEDEEKEVTSEESDVIKPMARSLSHVPQKYSAKSLSEFLYQPLKVRASGRMPDMKLTPAESEAIAGYLLGEQEKRDALQPDDSLAAAGKKYFKELNCAACHTMEGMSAAPLASASLASLKSADAARGCLSKTSGNRPQFHLPDAQTQAIMAALQDDSKPDSDAVQIAKTLTTFNCIGCHVRDDYGGIPEEYNPFYLTSERNLGDEGRLPPPLTLLGAKLQPAWLKKVLFDGESVRPYLSTRMPQYGTANLHHLPDLVARTDVLESRDMKIPSPESRSDAEREREKLLRKAGQELLGDKGLNCINCHNFNGKPSPVNKGMDLMTSYQRLQPGWFNNFLRSPGTYRPRIVMPTAWSNGIASQKAILDGDTDMQIEAIWYYLSLGTSAADPSGIRWSNTKLVVGNEAMIHRGRSRVAGFRGIAVGLPEKISYAFNAETGTLSALWKGDFVGVNWNGQGSGDFNPGREPITLAQDVSLVQLTTDDTPWPLMPVMSKEARTNPDPLYPKNHGYQFKGYFLDESSIPTFMYRSGTIEIEDRTTAAGSDQQQLRLIRVLQFDSPAAQTIWFRALTGEISAESVQVFKAGRLRLTVPHADGAEVQIKQRPLPDNPASSELLLKLELPQGQSTQEIFYEPVE